jgi:hypothetical protein
LLRFGRKSEYGALPGAVLEICPRGLVAAIATGSPFTLAEIAERVGDTKVVTAEHYLYALGDYAELDYRAALAR